ncbi:hypothetical protein K505DRAFT_80258 [Melanomma pulvis-pyrius CBS 109.77]|uniref:Uncharacterized protein n=1 Tax=Melanomma pulvis-pyrius CBS 109.77 TaxID=1314802 RepID=A0A6A6XSP6_9PLEO|nr:hypothetical protein K505DRAFT_80258 [Melanomma pulvis-pyrius CBS 109.77]
MHNSLRVRRRNAIHRTQDSGSGLSRSFGGERHLGEAPWKEEGSHARCRVMLGRPGPTSASSGISTTTTPLCVQFYFVVPRKKKSLGRPAAVRHGRCSCYY